MIPETTLKEMVWRIQTTPGLEGCLVGYVGDNGCRVIGHPSCTTPNSENVAVVIEEVYVPQDAPAPTAKPETSVLSKAKEWIVTTGTRVGPELVGAAGSCTLAVVSGVGVIGSLGAEVPSAGTSTFLLVASWTGFVTGGLQCANGVVRVGVAFTDVDGSTLGAWDKNKVYVIGMLIVDAVGVAATVASLPFAVRKLWDVFTRLRAFKASQLSFDALRRLNRVERLRVVTKIFQESTQSGDGVVEIVQAAKAAGVGAKTMQGATGLSINHAATLQKIITQETVRQLHTSLKEVAANVAGLALSASPAKYTGSGSGSLNWVINLLDAGQPPN